MPLQNSFVINFTIPGGTSTITGLQPVLPLGSLVYQETIDNLLLSSSDVDTYNLAIDPHQTLSVIVTPVDQEHDGHGHSDFAQRNRDRHGDVTEPRRSAVLPAVQSAKGGTYQIQVSGGPGEYKVEPVLNALVDPAAYGGPPNTSIATAQPIDPYANKIAGNDDRTAVLGGLSAPSGGGGLFSTDRFNQALYSVNSSTGAATLIGPLTDFTSFSGMAILPSGGPTYISDVFSPNTGRGRWPRSTGPRARRRSSARSSTLDACTPSSIATARSTVSASPRASGS